MGLLEEMEASLKGAPRDGRTRDEQRFTARVAKSCDGMREAIAIAEAGDVDEALRRRASELESDLADFRALLAERAG